MIRKNRGATLRPSWPRLTDVSRVGKRGCFLRLVGWCLLNLSWLLIRFILCLVSALKKRLRIVLTVGLLTFFGVLIKMPHVCTSPKPLGFFALRMLAALVVVVLRLLIRPSWLSIHGGFSLGHMPSLHAGFQINMCGLVPTSVLGKPLKTLLFGRVSVRLLRLFGVISAGRLGMAAASTSRALPGPSLGMALLAGLRFLISLTRSRVSGIGPELTISTHLMTLNDFVLLTHQLLANLILRYGRLLPLAHFLRLMATVCFRRICCQIKVTMCLFPTFLGRIFERLRLSPAFCYLSGVSCTMPSRLSPCFVIIICLLGAVACSVPKKWILLIMCFYIARLLVLFGLRYLVVFWWTSPDFSPFVLGCSSGAALRAVV